MAEREAIELTSSERLQMARSAALAREQLAEAHRIAAAYTSHGGSDVTLVAAILGALASNYLSFTTTAASAP